MYQSALAIWVLSSADHLSCIFWEWYFLFVSVLYCILLLKISLLGMHSDIFHSFHSWIWLCIHSHLSFPLFSGLKFYPFTLLTKPFLYRRGNASGFGSISTDGSCTPRPEALIRTSISLPSFCRPDSDVRFFSLVVSPCCFAFHFARSVCNGWMNLLLFFIWFRFQKWEIGTNHTPCFHTNFTDSSVCHTR